MEEVAPVPASSSNKNKTVVIAIVSVIAILLLFTTGYFLLKNQSLEKSLTETKGQNAELEKDIILYKSTDLAKEVEILNLKLKTAEEDLTSTKSTLDKLKADVSSSPKIAKIASMMMATFGQQPPNCFSATDKANINKELAGLGDSEWTSTWNDFINDTNAENCSMSPDKLEQAVNYGLRKISEISTR